VVGLWSARLQAIGPLGIVSRFPAPAFCAVSLTALTWLLAGAGDAKTSPWFHRLSAAIHYLGPFLLAAFLLSFACQLYSEASERRARSFVILVFGLAALALAFEAEQGLQLLFVPSQTDAIAAAMQFAANADPVPHIRIGLRCLLAALAFLPFVVPYLRAGTQPGAFWQFSHKLTVSIIAATVGSGLAFGGVAAIFGTAKLLFGIEVPQEYYAKAGVTAFFLGAPLILLALTPAAFEELPKTGSAKEFASRSVSLLVRYILIPLVTVLSLMLAAYVLQVLWEQKFYEARLGRGALL
jgi:Domain of unknown function (DUF4153)